MRSILFKSLLAFVLVSFAFPSAAQRQEIFKAVSHANSPRTGASDKESHPAAGSAVVPPLPAGVTELKFSDFFAQPVGPKGLELTAKLLGLDKQRVRILGYMAQQEQPVPGMFLFNAIPVRLNEEHYGLADDLPAATLFVFMPKDRDKVVPHTRQLMLLTGILSVGNREETDGRMSTVRLALEMPEAPPKRKDQRAGSK